MIFQHDSYLDISQISFCGSIISSIRIREISGYRWCRRRLILLIVLLCIFCGCRYCASVYCRLCQCVTNRIDDTYGTVSCSGHSIYIRALRRYDFPGNGRCFGNIAAAVRSGYDLDGRNLTTADHNFYFDRTCKTGRTSVIGSIFVSCCICNFCHSCRTFSFSRIFRCFSTVLLTGQSIFNRTDDTSGTVSCSGYDIHIQVLGLNDPVNDSFGTIEKCCIVRFYIQNRNRNNFFIFNLYRNCNLSCKTGSGSFINAIRQIKYLTFQSRFFCSILRSCISALCLWGWFLYRIYFW